MIIYNIKNIFWNFIDCVVIMQLIKQFQCSVHEIKADISRISIVQITSKNIETIEFYIDIKLIYAYASIPNINFG